MTSYYETNEPAGNVNVYCNCGAGEHQMLFLAKADTPGAALEAIPAGFSRSSGTVAEIEQGVRRAGSAARGDASQLADCQPRIRPDCHLPLQPPSESMHGEPRA